jgi:hypothetical protein
MIRQFLFPLLALVLAADSSKANPLFVWSTDLYDIEIKMEVQNGVNYDVGYWYPAPDGLFYEEQHIQGGSAAQGSNFYYTDDRFFAQNTAVTDVDGVALSSFAGIFEVSDDAELAIEAHFNGEGEAGGMPSFFFEIWNLDTDQLVISDWAHPIVEEGIEAYEGWFFYEGWLIDDTVMLEAGTTYSVIIYAEANGFETPTYANLDVALYLLEP